MNDSKISVRYSRALFQTAVEKNLLDKVYQDMIFISELCRMDEVKEVLKSPIIVPSKKKSILFSVLQKNIEPVTLSLVDILIKNGREDHLPAVARVFRDETLKYRGITESSLTTAVQVSEKIRKEIIELISSVFKTKVELKETVDSEIIGGFILRVNDNYIDASVRSKLRTIRKGLSVKTSSREL
ncbi:MAG: ATP synthase F1 subunit delta [Bacteroidales bacterium]|jgi:F-type H+-transporting ATPase subunit delta